MDQTNEKNMDHVTATANYVLLKTLPPRTKICINRETGKMSLDARWFMSTRRFLTGDSRKDLEQPMRQTFLWMQASTPKDELLQTLAHAHTTLKELYESAPEIDNLFQHIVSELEVQSAAAALPTPPPTPPTTPVSLSSNIAIGAPPPMVSLSSNIAIGASAVVVKRTSRSAKSQDEPQKPEDIRIDIDFDLPEEPNPDTNKCGLYDIFPCLRLLSKWLREKLSDDDD